MPRKRPARAPEASPTTTLVGDEGQRIAGVLAECALGSRPIEDLDGAGFHTEDGTLALRVDQATLDAFHRNGHGS